MALTPSRWILATAVACAAVWFFLFRSERPPAKTLVVPPTPSRVTVAANAMSLAADRLRLLRIRDSVMHEAATQHAGSLSVLISPSYGDALARQIDTLVRRRWAEAGAPTGIPVVIAAVVDSSTIVDGAPRRRPSWTPSISAFLPDTSRSAACVSILRVASIPNATSPRTFRRNLIAPQTIGGLVGPCLYYAAFGSPGPQVAHWLGDGNWRAAQVTDWHTAPPPAAPRFIPYTPSVNDRGSSAAYDARVGTSTAGLACLAGEQMRCAQAVLPPSRPNTDSVWRQRVVSTTGANDAVFTLPRGRNIIGPADGWLLSEMVRTLGKERFTAFWRSSEPVPDAFRAASNQSLDSWVHAWAVRMYGPLPIGPGLGGLDVLYGMLLLLGGIGVALAVARARRVS